MHMVTASAAEEKEEKRTQRFDGAKSEKEYNLNKLLLVTSTSCMGTMRVNTVSIDNPIETTRFS